MPPPPPRPGPVRAIMAWVCVNVAFYGMWRTLALIGRAPGWRTGGLLVLSALSALLGIAHAAVQNRLSWVIAYASIENTCCSPGRCPAGGCCGYGGSRPGGPRLVGHHRGMTDEPVHIVFGMRRMALAAGRGGLAGAWQGSAWQASCPMPGMRFPLRCCRRS